MRMLEIMVILMMTALPVILTKKQKNTEIQKYDGNPGLQANLTKEQQKQLIAQMLTEVPLIDG